VGESRKARCSRPSPTRRFAPPSPQEREREHRCFIAADRPLSAGFLQGAQVVTAAVVTAVVATIVAVVVGTEVAADVAEQASQADAAPARRLPKCVVDRSARVGVGKVLLLADGRDIVVFHVNGEFFALLNRCPHEGAPLDKAACIARLTSPEPGVYQRSRVGELLRCPWHGWEFDMRNGQSWFDPKRVKVRSYPVVIEDGETLAKGPYVAETFPVHIEDSYVIVET
jgi:nitrite reductase/ring-hydroxylating ferredoxin subunit